MAWTVVNTLKGETETAPLLTTLAVVEDSPFTCAFEVNANNW